MVVADVVLDLGIAAGIGIRRLHLEDRRPVGYVLVHVVRLVVRQLELGCIVVDVRHADGQLHRGGEATRVLGGCDNQLIDMRLTQVLEVEVLGQLDYARIRANVEGASALTLRQE